MTDKKAIQWVAVRGVDVGGKRYNRGDPVPATVAKKHKWLTEQGVIVKAGN